MLDDVGHSAARDELDVSAALADLAHDAQGIIKILVRLLVADPQDEALADPCALGDQLARLVAVAWLEALRAGVAEDDDLSRVRVKE